jgi:hypothetical protein
VNGAFESRAPDTWLEVDNDSGDASLEQLTLADALLLGRKVYQGLAAVWPYLGDDPPSAASPSGSTTCPSTSLRER